MKSKVRPSSAIVDICSSLRCLICLTIQTIYFCEDMILLNLHILKPEFRTVVQCTLSSLTVLDLCNRYKYMCYLDKYFLILGQILFEIGTNPIPAVFLDGLSLGDYGVVQMAGGAEQVEGHPVLIVLLNLVQPIWHIWCSFSFENLGVEKKVDKLWKCGCFCIPGRSTCHWNWYPRNTIQVQVQVCLATRFNLR